MLKAITHSPIHWERDDDPKLEQVIEVIDDRKSPASDKISSKLSPVPPPSAKAAWVIGNEPSPPPSRTPTSPYSDYDYLELDDETKKRSIGQRTPSPTENEERKKLRTPSQFDKILSRPMSAPNRSCSVTSHHSRPNSSGSSRSSVGLDFNKTHGEITAKNLKKSPNLSTYTRAYTGTNIERQVINRPRILEDRKRNYNAKSIKFQRLPFDRYKDKNTKLNSLPRDMSAWKTEYQGNFKSFKH